VAYFNVLFNNSPGETERNDVRIPSGGVNQNWKQEVHLSNI
jgi:hypothetical protein